MSSIRNFSIIAHIDHGKTTLTDRFLNLTKTVEDRHFQERMMDSNPIERERGITIKLAPVRMEYKDHIFNLIDTPGHVDFGYEVSRSLAACEGALLLIDATQGIQAQTLSNFDKAHDLGLVIIPVLNKVDLPSADTDAVSLECMEAFGVNESDILHVSAKTGQGVEELIDAIIERIPAPTGDVSAPLRALTITSQFDDYKGAIALVRVVDGELGKDKLHLVATETNFEPIDIGVFTPEMKPAKKLVAGEVGYICTGMKSIQNLRVGDTVTAADKTSVTPLPGYKEPQPMVFMDLYPIDAADFHALSDAMAKLALHDAALQFRPTHSQALGNGLRVGFLGILHSEIIRERLEREFDLNLIATAPAVPYQVSTRDGKELIINNPAEMPDPSLIASVKEPMAQIVIITPRDYLSVITKLIHSRRGEFIITEHVGERARVKYRMPLAEIITDLHDALKSATSGFASLEYEPDGYQEVDAVKVSMLVNKEEIEALSFMAVRDQAEQKSRTVVKKLKEVIPRQMFVIPIQAALGGKVIARETVKAYRKDVTAKLYGGDVTRRQKLLKKQAKGKKKRRQFGKVELNQEAFLAVLGS